MVSKIKKVFGEKRIVAVAGMKNTGKTNNIISLIVDFRKQNNTTPIYAYGLPDTVMQFIKRYKVTEISSLRHLLKKKDCILILDEFQRLKLNDRRYKDELDEFIDYVYHSNVYVLLCSPNIREFNSVIGGIIERWVLKDIRIDQCINGSQLKKVIDGYKGRHKELGSIIVAKSELLVIDDETEVIIKCDYIEAADNKKSQKNVL